MNELREAIENGKVAVIGPGFAAETGRFSSAHPNGASTPKEKAIAIDTATGNDKARVLRFDRQADGNIVVSVDEEKNKALDKLAETLTKPETGRRADKLMRRLFEYKESCKHPRIPACGHKFDGTRQPRMRNCDECWFTFFVTNEQLVKDTDNLFRNPGPQRVALDVEIYHNPGAAKIVELQGNQFLRKFLGFMVTMAEIQERVAQAQAEAAPVEETQ
jgi:hypothetical protein